MRTIIYTCLLAIVPFLLIAADPDFDRTLTGYWFNPKVKETIKVKDNLRLIEVEGLPGIRNVAIFELAYGKTYRDRAGNRLTVEDRNTIVFQLGRRDFIRFEKFDTRKKDIRQYRNFGNRDNDCMNNDNYPYGEYYKDDYQSYSNGYQNNHHTLNNSVQGTWRSEIRGREEIAIIETRDGLKAKVTGTAKWVEYDQSKYTNNEYIDRKGNKLVFTYSNALWISENPKDAVIQLQKIDNEIRY